MVTIELEFERPTKSKVRFRHDDFGTVYVPNAVFDQLGRPERLSITLEPARAAELRAA